MDFRCCVRLIEYGSLWHGLDSPIIPLRYRLLRHHQVNQFDILIGLLQNTLIRRLRYRL
mgnify:CR=1 FL=1